jgi:hypothetical protein
MLRGKDISLFLAHRGEVLEAFHDLHTAKPAERDTVTRLPETEAGLYDRVQQIGLVDDPHLAARRLAPNGCHLDVELRKTHLLSARSAGALLND